MKTETNLKELALTVIRMRNQEKRRDRRQHSNLVLIFEENEFHVIDCSLGGLAISNGIDIFKKEQELIAILSMPRKDQKPVTMKIALKVTRVDDQAEQTAFQFENLSSENFTILEKYLTHRSTLPLK